jgi:serine/threonine-protein kinase
VSDVLDRLGKALADRYQLVREVGSGGMATVYLATDLRHQRRVALKVLRPELSATMGPERFLQEVRVTANLQHPHILPLFDSGEADGFLFYVMPFVDGESLRERLVREGELPVPEAARLLRDVVDALAAAHALGIVHRDVKPENILLSGRHAMVTDFGVAKAVSEATGRHQLTTAGVALGTPAYMAPEQAVADTHLDHRVDIYAVGAVAYELLTGAQPFTGTSQQILAAQVTQAPTAVTARRPAVPPGLAALVMRCLEKKPADRWQRADELLPHLEAFATPSGGMTPTQMLPASRPTPGWLRAGLSAAVVAAVAAGLWLGWPSLARRVGLASDAAEAAVDPGLFAVFPFRVSSTDPSLAYLREGMVDLLHVKLAATRRSVEPRTLLDGWRRAGGGDADPPLDAMVGLTANLAAGRLVLGSVVGAPQQLTLSASVYAAPGGEELATASVSGAIEELPSLIDRLTAEIVSLEAGEAQDRLDALTTTSQPALLAYLSGMSSYRRGQYRDATESFVAAVQADSTFALAALYMGEANGMVIGGVPGAAGRAAPIVRAHRDRLGPRDLAYSRFLVPDSGDSRTALQRWEAAVTQLPDRPEAWYYLGDQLFHNGAWRGWDGFLGRSKEAFSRAVALDSTYFATRQHLMWIAQVEGDTAFVRQETIRYLETESTGAVAEEFRFQLAFLERDSAAIRRLDAQLESITNETLEGLTYLWHVDVWSFDMPTAHHAAEVLVRRATTPAARSSALNRQYYVAMNAGRPRQGNAVIEARSPITPVPDQQILGSLFWDGDESAAARAAQSIAAMASPTPAQTYALALWRLSRGDREGPRSAVRRLRAPGAPVGDSVRAWVLEAQLAHVESSPRADSLLSVLDAGLGRNTAWLSTGTIALARLYEARGDLPPALATTRRVLWNIGGDVYSSTFLRDEGRIAAKLGLRDDAIRAYTRYLQMRAAPEPELQPQVDSVRAELTALRVR